jgi:hypothetical protein
MMALLVAVGVGCELLVELDGLENERCRPDQKACPNEKRCVSLTDPKTGCADPDSCAPCVLSHASAVCEEGACAVAACVGDYRHCSGATEGCETDLAHDPRNCGACANQCVIPNGYPGCSARQCAVGGCFLGWNDCDGEWSNGCETEGGCP